MTGPTDSELENAIEADYLGDSTEAVRALFAQHPPADEPTAAPTRPTRKQVRALDRLVRAAVESARDPHGMTLTVDETTDAVVDQLIEEAPAFVALLAAQDEFSTTPNKEGDGCDNEHLTRGRTRPVDGPVLQGAEGAGLQRGERRDADGAGLRDRPHAVEAPRDLTEPSGALADAGEGTAQPDPSEQGPIETWLAQRPQRQDSLTDQLTDLHRVAARLGMYDAADWLWKATATRASGEGTAPQVPAEVAWEGQTEPMVTDATPAHSNLYRLPFTPGTYVRVVAADGAPQEGDER